MEDLRSENNRCTSRRISLSERPKKSNNEWLVRQEIKVECPKEANAKAPIFLNKGVDSLSFHVKAKNSMRNTLKHC